MLVTAFVRINSGRSLAATFNNGASSPASITISPSAISIRMAHLLAFRSRSGSVAVGRRTDPAGRIAGREGLPRRLCHGIPFEVLLGDRGSFADLGLCTRPGLLMPDHDTSPCHIRQKIYSVYMLFSYLEGCNGQGF